MRRDDTKLHTRRNTFRRVLAENAYLFRFRGNQQRNSAPYDTSPWRPWLVGSCIAIWGIMTGGPASRIGTADILVIPEMYGPDLAAAYIQEHYSPKLEEQEVIAAWEAILSAHNQRY